MGQSMSPLAHHLDVRITHVFLVALLSSFVVVELIWWFVWREGSRLSSPLQPKTWWQRFDAGSLGRTVLQAGFGLLWLADGLLQAQASMPHEFVPMVLQPAFVGQPAWVANLGRFAMNLWSTHAVTVDSFTVFTQLAIGLGILLGGDSILGRIALFSSVVWGIVVWVFGEGFGGVFRQGATWLDGAPGAVLVYIAAALLLLTLPPPRWDDRVVGRWVLRGVGVTMVLSGLLQALPQEGFWHGNSLVKVFTSAASNHQPRFLSAPIVSVADLAKADPWIVNLVSVIIPIVVGFLLLYWRFSHLAVVTASLWLFATWWFGMDFGVIGGSGTDPNIALPVGVFLFVGWIGWRQSLARSEGLPLRAAAEERVAGFRGEERASSRLLWLLRHPVRTWLTAAMAGAALWSAVAVIDSLSKVARF